MMQQQQRGGFNQTVDRSARSIFVGNISYDIAEDEIRKLLSACGQIVGFRLVHDRDTGRPKGFGFCEFADVQMAEAAIRNFNGYELHGRPLRVDSATGHDRSADEVQQFQMTMTARPPQQAPTNAQTGGAPNNVVPEENPYGPEPEAGKAPEVIARTVASMPPEKMFELMRSMKETVNNNPQMARQLLIENPQLSYALLQAQVVMRVVDPKVAYSMLHREQAQPLAPPNMGPPPSGIPPQPQQFQGPPQQFNLPPPNLPPQFNMPPPAMSGQFHNFPPPNMAMQQAPPMGMPPPGIQPRFPVPPPQQNAQRISPIHMVQQQQVPTQQQQQPQPMQSQQNNDNLDEEQQAQMLVRVLQLTDDQIRMLPPTERAQVIELRNQLRSAGAST